MDMGHVVFRGTQSEVVRCLCWGSGWTRGARASEQGDGLGMHEVRGSQSRCTRGWAGAPWRTMAHVSGFQTLLHTRTAVVG